MNTTDVINATDDGAGALSGNLLAVFDGMEIRSEDLVPACDLEFCKKQQDACHESLAQLRRWHDLLRREAEAENCPASWNVSFMPCGVVKYREPHCGTIHGDRQDYDEFCFRPFETINRIFELYCSAVRALGNSITGYFNEKYNICVPEPEPDENTNCMGFLPSYGTYLVKVMEYLDGRDFRSAAVDGIIKRFHRTVKPSLRSSLKPELKNGTIVFPGIIRFDDFYLTYRKNYHIHYNSRENLENFCEGVAFGACGSLKGGSSMVAGFRDDDVDLSKWYALGNHAALKFYRNGRVDVKFTGRQAAAACFAKLRLDELRAEDI